jgi:hypothetical protein
MIMLTIPARTNGLSIASGAGLGLAVIRVRVVRDLVVNATSARVAEDPEEEGPRGGVRINSGGRKVVGRITGRSSASRVKLPRLCRRWRCVSSRTPRRWKV